MKSGKRALNDLDRDIRDHIERETQDNIERGMSADDARHQAMLTFGSVALAKEDARAVWIPVWLEQLVQDGRYGLRVLRRNLGFAAAVMLTLAVGIGMNTAVFSVFNAVLLRPISYPDPDRLVWLSLHGKAPFNAIPFTEFMAWREQAASFERMVAYENTQNHTLQTPDSGTQVRNMWVSDDFWALTGARPALGRLPTPGEENVLVLSHRLFERWFQSDPNVAGRVVSVNGRDMTITGVLARDFPSQFPQEALGPALDRKDIDVYRPYGASGPAQSQQRGRGVPVRVVAKLGENVTIEQARAELAAVRARLAQARPEPSLDQATLNVVPLHEQLVGNTRVALWILLAAVAFVLLVACANIANLLLARASSRHKEIAIRASVGADRARLLRQLLAESLVLAILGGAAGLVLARWGLNAIVRLIPPEAMPRLAEATVDGHVLLFVLGTSVMTALLFGVVPARFVWKVDPAHHLTEGTKSASGSQQGLRGRRALVAVQLALAVVLLSGAGLMVKSFWRMNTHAYGFDPERILTLKFMFTADYLDVSRRHAYVDELSGRLRSLSGVESAGIIATGGASPLVRVRAQGRAPTLRDEEPAPITHVYATSENYRNSVNLRLVSGRWLRDNEPRPVVVISESIARREFGDANPIGRHIRMSHDAAPAFEALSFVPIVGVVADMKYSRLDAAADPTIYMPYRHYPRGFVRFTAAVRTNGDPEALVPRILAVLSEIDRRLPVFDVMTLEQSLADSIAPRRFNLLLLSAFALAALLLALIGIYGVIAYSVAQRTPEIGIRMAMGAQRGEVVRMVVREGMGLASAGIFIGLLGALALTGFIETLLYDVQPADSQTLAAVSAVMSVTALVACCGPALRAALVDPVVALRGN